LILNLTQA